jgi:hypothetical protein
MIAIAADHAPASIGKRHIFADTPPNLDAFPALQFFARLHGKRSGRWIDILVIPCSTRPRAAGHGPIAELVGTAQERHILCSFPQFAQDTFWLVCQRGQIIVAPFRRNPVKFVFILHTMLRTLIF